MSFNPPSIRFAISISPSRVKSSTEPISRMYIRTGSVVRPKSESTVCSAASAAASASSSLATVATLSDSSNDSASGAWSYTAIPISLKVPIMPSIASGSTMFSGRWSLISACVKKPRSLPNLIKVFSF